MPCFYEESEYEKQERKKQQGRIKASLCGVLTAAESLGMYWEILDRFDYEEAGVTREWLENWWGQHKIADARRRREEQAQLERVRKAEEALSKLTPEEREVLGL